MTNCYYHSRNETVHHCRHCHRDICQACTILVEGEPFCQVCWDGYVAILRNYQSEEKNGENPSRVPWQHWREMGPVKAFFETAGQIVFQPSRFFSQLPTGKELKAPLLFAIICILVFWYPMNVLYIKYIFPPILQNLQVLPQEENAEEQSVQNSDTGQSSTEMQQAIVQRIQSISVMEILTMPINFFFMNILIASLFQQMLITLFRGKEGYAATFQIRCYATIAQCLILIPFVGILLAEIGSLFVCIRGFQVVQKITFSQSLCVALVPIMISFLALPSLW